MKSIVDFLGFGIRSGLRLAHSGWVFSTQGLGVLGQVLAKKGNNRELGIALRQVFENLGATYIKLGQFIASAPSFFPEEIVEEMQKCLDSVRPVPFSQIKAQVEKEWGYPLTQLFETFGEIPLASASIAQVHAATTKDGLDVVVKVQRPDIEATLKTDMQILSALTRVLEWIAPEFKKVGITGMFEEFQNSILQEIDFIKEAQNIEEFETYLLKAGETRARVPRVYHRYTTKRVLVMERFYGVPITDEKGLRSYTKDPRKVLNTALEIWFSSLAKSGFFHADVHAGNLMILRDGQIGFIDFGIVGRISTKVWNGLMLLTQGIGLGDANLVAQGLVTMDSTNQNTDPKILARDLGVVFTEMEKIYDSVALGEVTELDERQMNHVMYKIKEISEKNGLKIPREFALLMKQMLYFDRYVKSMAPEINLFRDTKSFISS